MESTNEIFESESIDKLDEESEFFERSHNDVGRISLSFIDAEADKYPDNPSSYYTFSAKERLLLIYTENFRRQFIADNPERASLILAVHNECGIQKFVSTTIRPSVLLYPELINSWSAVAQYVADTIVYQPLDVPTEMVSAFIFLACQITVNGVKKSPVMMIL